MVMFCGAYAYAFIPANAIGGPCTIGRLATVMATADTKNINKETKLYYEVMNSSLYHDPGFYREPVSDDTVEREEHEHSQVHEHEDASKHKEPHIIIYTYPTVHWPVARWGAAEHEPVDEHVKKYRGKRSALSDAYSANCDDEVVVLSKVEAGILGIFAWGATYYNNLQLGHLACALAKSINILHNITTHLTHVTDSNALKNIWNGLTSWLPDLTWIKEVFLGIVIIIVIGLISCICIQCMPMCKLFFHCCRLKNGVKCKSFSQQEIRLLLRELD
ncbi:hypothetical protein E2320_022713, partial [Naja naja]